MDINWDEAPKGFDYALTTAPDWDGAPEYKRTIRFAKKIGNSAHFECSKGLHPHVGPRCWVIVATRPEKWNGEGLPPVGSKVVFYSDDFENEDYWNKDLNNESEVEIIAHIASSVRQNEADLAVFAFQYPNGGRQVEQAVSCCFRPIKTKEQLAAEEREKAIEEMLRIFATGVWDGGAPAGCKALYDAGYRKQENIDEQA